METTETKQQMNWTELLTFIGADEKEIMATIISPVRKGDIYQKGRVTGFKSGLYGGGHYKFKKGVPFSFASDRMHWIKKPKVHVTL